jgi:hypothetical protein
MVQFRLLLMTAVLTTVIWVTADSLVNQKRWVAVEVSVISAEPDKLVTATAESNKVQVQIVGPRKVIDQVEQARPLAVRLQVPEQPAGKAILSLRELLREQWGAFPRLSILAVTPATFEVTIDSFVETQVPIVLKPLANSYETRPQLQPASACVRLPEGMRQRLAENGELRIEVDADAALREQPAGESVTVSVPLDTARFGPRSEVEPSVVQLTGTIRVQRKTIELRTVPVLVGLSFRSLGRPVRAVGQDGSSPPLITRTLVVSGPMDTIESLQSGDTRVYGLVRLRDSDLDRLGEWLVLAPRFDLPPGVELVQDPAPVEIKLERAE